MDLLTIAEHAISLAQRAGATDADAVADGGTESSVAVRDGEIENVTQATTRAIAIRVFVEGRLGFATGSDLSPEGLDQLARGAVAAAKVSSVDPHNGLPEMVRAAPAVERLFDPRVVELTTGQRFAWAALMEKAARGFDPRVKTISGSEAASEVHETAIASTRGVRQRARGTAVQCYVAPVAEAGAQLQTGHWSDSRRFVSELESPESIGRRAAERAVRMLGARSVASCEVPVIFDPLMAASFVAGLLGAINGDMVHKRASVLGDLLGETIASPLVTVVDDGTLPGALGSWPFDGEGLPHSRQSIIDRGRLQMFMYDTYTARKAGAKSTAHASRGSGIGPTNFMMLAGTTPAAEIVRSTKRGFYVTAMLGRGVNTVTGDYSRGANGLWIEDGVFTHAVHEVTVAGSFIEMLQAIDQVGSDLELRASVSAPTIRFARLTVSGT